MSIHPSRLRAARLSALALLVVAAPASAFVVEISADNRNTSVYLRVGDGDFSNASFVDGGAPRTGGQIGQVRVSVPAAALLGGTPQAMTANTRVTSDYDRFAFCNAGEVYIGGYFRGHRNDGAATLSVAAPAGLTNTATGETIGFGQISWTTRGNASGGGNEAGPQPVPGGSFAAPVQALASFPVNTWRESCMQFTYGNSAVVAAGEYTGRVTYTLASP